MVSRRAKVLLQCFQVVAAAAGGVVFTVDCVQRASAASPAGEDAGDALVVADADPPVTEEAGPSPEAGEGARADTSAEAATPAPCTSKIDSTDGGGPDGEELCIFTLTCGVEQIGLATVGCQVVPTAIDGTPISDPTSVGFPTCIVNEGEGCENGKYAPTEAGIVFTCLGCPGGGGRRPAGLVKRPSRAASEAGAYFAEMGRIEAASVRAFADLARRLTDFGAPEPLVAGVRASAGDEVRHARAMRRLAGRFAARPGKVEIRARRSPSLAALARENAVEGCVRETFGALVNAWQASRAQDPAVRAAMRTIARDELRHAALAWEIDAWIEPRLRPSERRSLARARRRAVARLIGEMNEGPSGALRCLAGLPSADEARALARGLADRLWS
ncbi:MAG TPA: ferritin-like domain-containing protein [Polyangiaceae bacterium]|jgi:hypothetical protein